MARTQIRWMQEDFPAVVLQVSINQAQTGQQNIAASITGRFTHFVQGKTIADFGMGIVVTAIDNYFGNYGNCGPECR